MPLSLHDRYTAAMVENKQLREDAQLLRYALVSLRGEMLEPHQYKIIDQALKGRG